MAPEVIKGEEVNLQKYKFNDDNVKKSKQQQQKTNLQASL